MKKIYLFFLVILLSMQSFGLQYEYGDRAHCTSNTMSFTSETTSKIRPWIYSSSDFAAVSPSGNIVAAYTKTHNSNQINDLKVKTGAVDLKHMFNMLNLNS
ncbi:hypothetical protein PFY12_03170 [Chryseobacterium camelliae]|uniref:Uncharacterized protein n=1 Tax=Chryseobacterium camelliae TaxID=1265445 RepID=A0ABY7QN73_9FLAO|nr:hypothetical protein [Chryseobacterium camelliae]WBV61128.1 hypothetical protein PFY12_03170 [Chryseobacterium camelliae]